MSEALRGLESKAMVRHEALTGKVSCVTYEDGTKIYVNYGDSDYTDGGLTVEARSYVRR